MVNLGSFEDLYAHKYLKYAIFKYYGMFFESQVERLVLVKLMLDHESYTQLAIRAHLLTCFSCITTHDAQSQRVLYPSIQHRSPNNKRR